MAELTGNTPRWKYLARWVQLTTERSSWISLYMELSKFLLPFQGRYFSTDRNKGTKRYNAILDSTGTKAHRSLSAGLMSGMTSPARPWFALGTNDPRLKDSAAVKQWFSVVTQMMLDMFAKANVYQSLHLIYDELGAFGTGGAIMSKSVKTVMHLTPLTAGEYAIAHNFERQVDTLYREFELSVAAVVKEFGYDNCSPSIQAMWDAGTLEAWVRVVHCVEPREDRDLSKADNKNFPFKSVYFEWSQSEQFVLRESGFKTFPVLAPRWALAGGDIYGNSPAMMVLGDLKQLQQEQRRKAEAIDYQSRPPLQMPTSAKNQEHDLLPGGVSYVDQMTPNGGVRTAFDVKLDVVALLEDIQDVRMRIKEGFFEDLFLMLQNLDSNKMTATEIAQRNQEKLMMLGPVLERLNPELLVPLVNFGFEALMEVRQADGSPLVPPPPPELQGMPINIEFISVLHQAQRAIGVNNIDRFVGALIQVAQAKPEVLDNFDADQWAEDYADSLGVDPKLIVDRKLVAQVRAQRQAQAQAQAAQAGQNVQSQTAANLAQIQTQGGRSNAAADIMSNLTGYQ